jgi:phosphohistidine phosphatase SixA
MKAAVTLDVAREEALVSLGNAMLGTVTALIGALAALAVSASLDAAADGTPAPHLVSELRNGGFIIFFRHGETGPAYSDRAAAAIGDCSTQRNLNEAGRRQVAELGEDFKALRIPVGSVLSSEFCRCWQHAEAMFGRGRYVATEKLNAPASYPAVNATDRELNNKNLGAILAEVPPAGTNTVLVSHGVNVHLLTGYHPDVQGEAVVFRPDGRGGFERVATLLPGDWRRARRELQLTN